MDSVFQLEDGARSSFIQMMMQSLGSSYFCLWSSLSQSSCLVFLDGLCHDVGNGQPNALFDQYKQSVFIIQPIHSQVPGFAFGNNTPYIEVREDQFPTLASNDIQRQFYQEERIKMAIFMGCRSGEIEIGFSNTPLADMEMQMMSLFPDDFLRNLPLPDIQIPASENVNPRPSSSSSSLRSPFSIDSHSPEYSSLLFNLPSTSATPAAASSSSQALLLTTPSAITPTTATTFLEQLTCFSTSESEHAAMTNAFLAVMTSPSLSSTLNQPQQNPQPPPQQHLPQENLQPSAFARGMNLIRLHERLQGVSSGSARPMSSTHIHHVMSERKRREKLNESYQSLKTLLPPGTKKYKAAVLAATREYLTLLRSQVEDLRRRNAVLEAQLLPPPNKEAATAADESAATSSHEQSLSREEVSVRTVSNLASTSSQDRTADLRVIVRRDVRTLDLVARILEFLRQARNVNVLSINADTQVTNQGGIENHVALRLHVEGGEWDESALEEAVRRVVADFSQ